MNGLLFEMKRSLIELDMGLKGDLSITESMEALMNALYDDKVPATWAGRAYPSLRALGPWLFNLLERQRQLLPIRGVNVAKELAKNALQELKKGCGASLRFLPYPPQRAAQRFRGEPVSCGQQETRTSSRTT